MVIIANIFTVVTLSFAIVFIFDFSFPDLGIDLKRKLSQAGTFMNIMAALFLSYKFILKDRYYSRESELYKKDEDLTKQFELAKHDIHTKDDLNEWAEKINLQRENIYDEMQNIYDLNKLDSAHIIMGLILIVLGSTLQMVGAG